MDITGFKAGPFYCQPHSENGAGVMPDAWYFSVEKESAGIIESLTGYVTRDSFDALTKVFGTAALPIERTNQGDAGCVAMGDAHPRCKCGVTWRATDCPVHGDPAALTAAARPHVEVDVGEAYLRASRPPKFAVWPSDDQVADAEESRLANPIHTNAEGDMTRIESVIGKMRSWLAEDEAKVPSGCARVLAFPESDVKALLEHIDGLSAPQEKVQGLGGKITNVDLAKEAEKLKT